MTSEFFKSKFGRFRKESYAFSPGEPIKERYRIASILAWGGAGEIYLAHDRNGKQVAVKTPWKERRFDPFMHDIFDNEKEALERSKHPGVVKLLDHGLERGVPFIVLEYLGTTLLENEYFSSIHPVVDIMSDICTTLEFIHSRGIVHRDIRPSNTFLRGLSTVLIDFQYASVPDMPNLSQRFAYGMGSPDYMAPEQTYQGSVVDHRADIYCLAVSLYVMAARVYSRVNGSDVFPFNVNAGTNQEYIERAIENHRSALPLPLHARFPNAPQELSHVIQKALSKDPEDRQQSAQEFKAELQGFLSNIPPPNYLSI